MGRRKLTGHNTSPFHNTTNQGGPPLDEPVLEAVVLANEHYHQHNQRNMLVLILTGYQQVDERIICFLVTRVRVGDVAWCIL